MGSWLVLQGSLVDLEINAINQYNDPFRNEGYDFIQYIGGYGLATLMSGSRVMIFPVITASHNYYPEKNKMKNRV